MVLALTYWAFLLGCGVYVVRHGPEQERQVFAALVLASLLSGIIASIDNRHIQSVALSILLVDLLLLLFLLFVASRTDRFWPLWTTGFHLIGVLTNVAMLVNPSVVPRAYALAQGFWAYPALLALCLGVHKRSAM